MELFSLFLNRSKGRFQMRPLRAMESEAKARSPG